MKKAVIIGGGISGLATAFLLRKRAGEEGVSWRLPFWKKRTGRAARSGASRLTDISANGVRTVFWTANPRHLNCAIPSAFAICCCGAMTMPGKDSYFPAECSTAFRRTAHPFLPRSSFPGRASCAFPWNPSRPARRSGLMRRWPPLDGEGSEKRPCGNSSPPWCPEYSPVIRRPCR